MEEKKLLLEYNLQFFAKDGPGGEKTEEPTQKKLDDARKEGRVAKSPELNSAFMLITLFVCIKLFVGFMGTRFLGSFNWAYSIIPDVTKMSAKGMTIATAHSLFIEIYKTLLITTLPFLAIGFAVAFVASVIQVGLKVSAKPLEPKFDKLNPVNGFKRIFSSESLFNLVKSIVKIFVIFYIAYSSLKDEANNLFILYDIPLKQAISLIGDIVINIGIKISVVYLAVGLIDYVFQKRKFKEDMKMTKQEVKDEYKNTEGDPTIKGQQRQRMREASQRRMMADVPKADVVITNPTHLACAIRYKPDEGDVAPVLIAKGEDYVAGKIKEKAREANIPIVEDKPTARAIYATVEIGQSIPPELYEPVAGILAVVYNNRGGL